MQLPLATFASGLDSVPNVLPGILRLLWAPSFGNSTLPTDPASIAGKEFYGRVRASFSGSIDADAPDFVIYIGALDSVFTYIGWLKRVYRTLTTFTSDNFFLPDGLMAAYGFTQEEATQLRRDKVRLWQGINELILKSRKFKCPAVMDLFNRHYWMSDNVYADDASTRAQLYVFNLAGVYALGDVTEVSGGETITGLVMTPLQHDSVSVGEHAVCDSLIEFGDALLRAIDAWDDGYLISGYLQRAFDATPSFTVAELMQDEQLTSQFVPEVLTQIENSRTVIPPFTAVSENQTAWATDIKVTQNVLTNAVVSNVNMSFPLGTADPVATIVAALPNGLKPMLSIRNDQPSVTDSVIASRLHAYVALSIDSQAKRVNVNVTAGSEIPLQWSVITAHYSTDGSMAFMDKPIQYLSMLDTADSEGVALTQFDWEGFFTIPQFDWHPFFTVLYVTGPESAPTYTLYPVGDTHNATTISSDQLANLHKVCMYSELNSFSI